MSDEPQETQEASAEKEGQTKRTFVENLEVAGHELVDRVKELLHDSNARRVIIRSHDGHELLTVPLTVGVVAGGLITLSAPLLAALGALAALVSRVKLEVIREEEDEDEQEGAEATEEVG
ncbi:MAG: DUF4342 domain-containing protein [Trueperaceae bacterium]|nr:MAG: DUF4342 domain-containing protein [Trueperaceae bacterium]